MDILVFNAGSSSLKYRLLSMPEERPLAGGEAQRVGPKTAAPARIVHQAAGRERLVPAEMADHAAAFDRVMELLEREGLPAPGAVGHRVVHGGAVFSRPTLVDDAAMRRLEEVREMAPLHNPPAMRLMEACRRRFPDLPQVAVFDTAFHATIPRRARTCPLPRDFREGLGLRKYGFHGTSHRFVSEEAARFLGKRLEDLNAVSCHLGSGGASLCAVRRGRSLDNTMGYSPLQGLVMSTRSGDLDAAAVLRMVSRERGDGGAVEKRLNTRSGVLGLSGFSADIRDVLARPDAGGAEEGRRRRTLDVYLWRIRKYLGAYLALLGRADAVIFTDTIGETVPAVRWAACAGLEAFGVKIDPERNRGAADLPADVAAADSPVRVLAIRTNEELAIAREAHAALAAPGGAA